MPNETRTILQILNARPGAYVVFSPHDERVPVVLWALVRDRTIDGAGRILSDDTEIVPVTIEPDTGIDFPDECPNLYQGVVYEPPAEPTAVE